MAWSHLLNLFSKAIMYNPQRFKSMDRAEAFTLMEQNPFATIISVVDGKPIISHLPLTPKKDGNKIVLIGHLARSNPHSKYLASAITTIIFRGAHTYITPQWYPKNDVPTWNYSIVHVSGKVELIENTIGLIDCLKELSSHAERLWPSGWDFFIPEDLTGNILPKKIVGFRFFVDEINFKRKLSQNKTPADRAGVLQGLESREDDNSRAVLADMLRLYFANGELK